MKRAKTHKTMLVINPISGNRPKTGLAERVRESLPDHELTVVETHAHGDATALARRAVDEGYEVVLTAGGDGTVNEAAAALRDTSTALGILPCGSGNGLARHIGLDISIEAGIEAVKSGRVVAMDYGTMNRRPFFCTCGVGFDAEVSDEFAHCNGRGLINYVKSTLVALAHFRPEEYCIDVDGRQWRVRAMLVTVANASQFGNNAYIAPQAKVTDGLLDVVIVRPGNLLTTTLVGIDMMTRRIDRNMLVDTVQATRVAISRADQGLAHIDGEPLMAPERLEVECHPAGLNIYMPAEA